MHTLAEHINRDPSAVPQKNVEPELAQIAVTSSAPRSSVNSAVSN
jgi:hypothetical protein